MTVLPKNRTGVFVAAIATVALSTSALSTSALFTSVWAAEITGAGATFPAPIYAKWAEAYKAKTGTALNYQPIGSGGGIKQIQSKTVDFGASDMPLKAADLDKSGLIQFPTVIGGIVPVVNLKGFSQINLTGPILADIYLGKIKNWNDKAIAAINPGSTLPDKAIAPVYRSDGSGTTFIFSHYLSQVSPDWKEKIGENTSVEFPTGLGGKGNEGVAAFTTRTDGAIGYVEYFYAKENKLPFASLVNHDGKNVAASPASFQAAAAGADWKSAPGYYVLLTNEPGAESWPITGATFILMYKKTEKADNAKQSIDFFNWAYTDGDKLASDLNYIPLPASLKDQVRATWKTIEGPSGPVWTAAK